MTRTRPPLVSLFVSVCATALAASCGPPPGTAGRPLPRIARFDAAPATVALGEPTTLSWTVEDADAVSIKGGAVEFDGPDTAGTLVVLPRQTTTYTLTATGPGGTAVAEVLVTVDAARAGQPPVIHAFTAEPADVDPGDATTLTWRVTGATALAITGGAEGVLHLDDEPEGARVVTPAQTTTFTLEATGPGGVSTADATVTVHNPRVVAFKATPEVVRQGQPVRLEWDTEDADAVAIDPDPSADAGRELRPDDAIDILPPPGETTYVLTATRANGGVEATAQVTVTVHAPPQIVSFTVTPSAARAGEAVFLAWQTVGAETVELSPLPDGPAPDAHRVQEPDGFPLIAVETTTFRLVATGPGGEAEATAELLVHPVPVVDRFEADPPEIPLGGTTVLRWSTSNADVVQIEPAISAGPVADDGSAEVAPAETTTYRLTASGPGGEADATFQVVVHPPPTIPLFEATPAEVAEGGNVTLRWRTLHAAAVSLEPDPAGVFPRGVLEGSLGIQPRETTTYTLTATSPGGRAEAAVLVTVHPRPAVLTFQIAPDTVTFGQGVTLSWSTENASTVEFQPAIGVAPETVNGEARIRPAGTGSYTLTAHGRGGRSEPRAVRVTVHPRPVIAELAADPRTIGLGGSSRLSWRVDRALRVWFAPGPEIAADAFAGEAVVQPDRTTTYTLHAESGVEGDVREVTRDVTVTVDQPPRLVRFVAEPPDVLVGGGATLEWEVTDAASVEIVDGLGAPVDIGAPGPGAGSVDVDDLRADAVYTLTARGPGGVLADPPQVTVTVHPARLRVSEVFFDYAGPGGDRGWEWIELYNPTDTEILLDPYTLGIGENDWRASAVSLGGTVAPGGCIVVGGPNSGPNNHNPPIDVPAGQGFNPTLRDDTLGVVAIGTHFMSRFSLPSGDPSLVPLDSVLYGWQNSRAFPDRTGERSPVHFNLYEQDAAGGILRDGDGIAIRRIQTGWSIARTSPHGDAWRPQPAPTPGLCFEDRPRPGPGWCRIQFPDQPDVPVVVEAGGETEALYGRVYMAGVTPGQGAGVTADGPLRAQVGYGPPDSDPDLNPFWVWTEAAYNTDLRNDQGEPNDDEHLGVITAPSRESDYAWAFRFSSDGVEWLYCDHAPGNDGTGQGDAGVFDPADAGILRVIGAP